MGLLWDNENEIKLTNDIDINDITLYGLFILLIIALMMYYVFQKCRKMKRRQNDLEARMCRMGNLK